jgi:hypothetical protein
VNQAGINSEEDIYLKYFSKDLQSISEDILVNDSINGPQINPQIASDNNGNLVIVWSSYSRNDPQKMYDIKAKIFSNRSSITEEFTVNTFTHNSQSKPNVAMKKEGGFAVAWESWFQDGSDRGIYAQLFNSNGSKNGGEFLVNTSTEYSQARPSVKYFNDGRFIISWESWNEAELGYNVFAKIFDTDGSVIKDEFMLNNYTENYQWMSDISINSDNSFDAVWCSWEQDGSDGGIYMRSFNSAYESLGKEILVNTSTEFYQWLPKIENLGDKNKLVVWSSWKLDGSREGIYYKTFSDLNKEITLEKRINVSTESFQWEPDILSLQENEMIATWSSWGETGNDYEIMIKKFQPDYLVGVINPEFFDHTGGSSTSEFIVHVVDSVKLNGHSYEITFNEAANDILTFSIEDKTISEFRVNDLPMDLGVNVQYLTDEFDGIIVELIPNFELGIDFEKSTFINNSGTNVQFTLENPVIFPTVAPLDISIIWGIPDTLANGTFSAPLDTALSPSNVREIELPFIARTTATMEKLDAVVFENAGTQNKRWDPGEDIVFLTPIEYRTNDFSTHVQVFSTVESDDFIWPNIGDTNYIYTIKPITVDDIYEFKTERAGLILGVENPILENSYKLYQNYPNPFNPNTTIKYSVPLKITSHVNGTSQKPSNVKLIIYDILGREIATLIDKEQNAGDYSVEFNASGFSSGVYFYMLQTNVNRIVKKMILLK